MNHAGVEQPRLGLAGGHRRAVVGHERPRKATFGEGLAQPVDEVLGGLGQVPLLVTAQARAVVEDPEQTRGDVLAARGEHRPRTGVEVQVPQRVGLFDLTTAHLTALEPLLGALHPGAVGIAAPRLKHHPARFHLAAHGRVVGHLAQLAVGLGGCAQVVVVQLVAPTPVREVLGVAARAATPGSSPTPKSSRRLHLRPGFLLPHRSFQPDVIQAAVRSYLSAPGSAYDEVATEDGCSSRSLWRWIGWLAPSRCRRNAAETRAVPSSRPLAADQMRVRGRSAPPSRAPLPLLQATRRTQRAH